MRATLFFMTALVITLAACSDDEVPAKPSVWGIAFSEPVTTVSAGGIIDRLTEGPRVTYAVDYAYLLGNGNPTDTVYTLTYVFTSHDSLRVGISKVGYGDDFHYPAAAGENRLRYAVFNTDTLRLQNSKITVDPRTGENKVATTLNLASTNLGTFVGTVSSVPLLRKF
jgi:hypothetical protein